MWPFKLNIAKILSESNSCKINIGETREKGGMFKNDKLHGYGYVANYSMQRIVLGIFKNNSLVKNLGTPLKTIQDLIGPEYRMISSQVFNKGVYIGEALSPAAYMGNPKLRKDRYGVLIMPDGMYVGSFPPGNFMTVCIGNYYDLNGKKNEGTFSIPVHDSHRHGDDQLGEYFPSY